MKRLILTLATLAALVPGSSAMMAQEPQTPGKEHEELKAMDQ